MSNENLNAPAAEAYTYQRLDGTVEQALNAEDAIARCPVLGKLALESPEQANVLLELAATGQAKLAAETETETQRPRPKPEEKTDIKSYAERLKPAEPLTEPRTVPSSQLEAALLNEVHQAIEPQIIKPSPVRRPSEPSKKPRTVKEAAKPPIDMAAAVQETRPVETNRQTTIPVAEPRAIEAAAELIDEQPDDNRAIAEDNVSIKENPAIEVTYVTPPDEIEAVPTTPEVERPVIEISADAIEEVTIEEVFHYPSPLLTAEETPAAVEISPPAELGQAGQLEVVFELETIETYYELEALETQPVTEDVLLAEVPEMPAIKPEPEAKTAIEAPLDWQELVTAQFDLAEEPRTLEDIQAEADEQPLEQTLLQLVKHLSEAAAEPESHEVWEITEEIAAEASPNPKITPELTDQLLALLRVLGYQNPREVLVDFVKKYDLAFLLQALRYIWELSSSRERPDTNLIGYNACAPEAAGL